MTIQRRRFLHLQLRAIRVSFLGKLTLMGAGIIFFIFKYNYSKCSMSKSPVCLFLSTKAITYLEIHFVMSFCNLQNNKQLTINKQVFGEPLDG